MDLFPAIDIRNGRVVRLSQGEAARQTVYGDNPAAVAARFAAAGARWIHVVDLDRAFGDGDNGAVVRAIVAEVGDQVRVQVGGGFRSLERIRKGLELGAARLVIGTAAVTDPALVPAALEAAGVERLAVGIDARNGLVAVRGWTETSSLAATELTRRVVDQGVTTIIYTDVARDGMMGGPDIAGALALQQVGARVIVSGGVAGAADIRAARDAGLAGAIIGRALYEGRLTLSEAFEAGGPNPATAERRSI